MSNKLKLILAAAVIGIVIGVTYYIKKSKSDLPKVWVKKSQDSGTNATIEEKKILDKICEKKCSDCNEHNTINKEKCANQCGVCNEHKNNENKEVLFTEKKIEQSATVETTTRKPKKK